ncbi:NAD(P)-dependent oxidoreductase [Pectobacterium carotovorum subsp. carotovorum]|nr:NAD(P)-dependent oxidoreductase [Pectobacterium carotovorum subsp. carotovorum]
MIAITGASGQLGRLVIAQLLEKVPASDIVALVRDVNKVADLSALGVQVKAADYNQPEALASALQGVDKVLLISSSEVGQRAAQHRNVIEAAAKAGVKLLAYTSLLHADKSPLALAEEHRQTEALLKDSGLPYVLLRNGWYTENYAASIPAALEHGVFIGSAGEGKITSATREDFAAAAVAVLTKEGQAGKVYELAGDEPYTLAELAAEISKQSGKSIGYQNLSEAEFTAALVSAGLPDVFAQIIADSDVGASKGGLFDGGKQLSQLIGRSTTPLSAVVKATLK